MDMRIRPESEQPGISMEELSPVEQAIQRCTTYDELYRVIDRIGDITTKNYELNIPTPKTYTVAEIKKSIDEVRDGQRSIHDICPLYRVKAVALLGTDRESRRIKIEL